MTNVDITQIVVIAGVLGIVGIIIWRHFKGDKKDKPFKPKSLFKETINNYKAIIAVAGLSGDSKPLMQGMHKIGKIRKYAITSLSVVDKELEIKGEGDIYLIQYIRNGLIWPLLAKLRIGLRFALVSKDVLTINNNNMVIMANAEPDPPFNCPDIVRYGKSAREKLLEVPYKITLFDSSESLANFTKKLAYLELGLSKVTEQFGLLQDALKKNNSEEIDLIRKAKY